MDDFGADFVLSLELGGSGPRVAIKDVIDIAGLPTRAGCRALIGRAPARANAVVVQRILDKGCRIVGKTNLHELAFGMTGVNDWTGTPVNPLYPHLLPGGSSSGSATAVAAGLCDWALGTDTGGSIRVPAACCGVVGFKPTFGRVSRAGLMPERSTLDCVGPLARTVAGIMAAMDVIDPTFAPGTTPRLPRVGIVQDGAEAQAVDAVAAALLNSGCELTEVALPGLDAAFGAAMTIMNAEMFEAFGHLLETGELGSDVAERLRQAAGIPLSAVREAEEIRAAFTSEMNHALARGRLDALAMPTLPGAPLGLASADDARAALAMSRLCRPFNLTGHPALSLPLAKADAMPCSAQLVAAKGEDERLCTLAAQVESQSLYSR